jgi:CubicO group peptidase (beta-lactamase class C family)
MMNGCRKSAAPATLGQVRLRQNLALDGNGLPERCRAQMWLWRCAAVLALCSTAACRAAESKQPPEGAASVQPNPTPASAALPADILDTVRVRLAARNYPGLVIGVVDASGKRSFGFGAGSASDAAPDEHTVYELGEVSEIFTALLLADMAERGVIDPNAPVAKYLPASTSAPTYYGQEIPVITLATHTSGLPRLPLNFGAKRPENPYAAYSLSELYSFLSWYRLPYAPGRAFQYSEVGAGLLGHVLALVAGKSYEELLEERVARPLGLGETRVTLSASMSERLAKGHSGGVEVENWDMPALVGAGGLRSTVHDLLTLVAANLGLLDSPLSAALRTMREDVAKEKWKVRRGLGWIIRASPRGDIHWRAGSTGGYSSVVAFRQDTQTGVVILANSNTSVEDMALHALDASIPLGPVKSDSQLLPVALEERPSKRFEGSENLVVNGDFSEGSALWGITQYVQAARLGPYNHRVKNGIVCMNVVGAERVIMGWPDTEMPTRPSFSLRAGTSYRLFLRASLKGPLPVDVRIKVGDQVPPYVPALRGWAPITNELKSFEVDFQAKRDVERAGVALIIESPPGYGETVLCVDEIALAVVDAADGSKRSRGFP